MTTPAISWFRFCCAFAMGVGLSAGWDLLAPLHRRFPKLTDLVLSLGMVWVWLVLAFRVSNGDIRLGSCCGAAAGWYCWTRSGSVLLRPLFDKLWKWVGRCLAFLARPLRKILKFFEEFQKNLFPSVKKWVTIRWNNRRRGRNHGGTDNGEETRKFQKGETGVRQEAPGAENGAGSTYHIGYGQHGHTGSGLSGSG